MNNENDDLDSSHARQSASYKAAIREVIGASNGRFGRVIS